MTRLSNPFSFSRASVTIVVFVTYIALVAALIWTQLELPRLPKSPTPLRGINLTEAWQDLQLLTAEYHPYNSRRNDFVHDWLLSRIETILKENNASSTAAYVFDDRVSNLTSSTASVARSKSPSLGLSVYFEGTNILVYVRGTEDDKSEWWKEPKGTPSSQSGVLVNAHYDSVSTGYGSTDDGVGVITVLQLIRYYTLPRHQPRNGIVFLLNNGEEDFLNGARAFSQNPMSSFVYTFLNLEGAGAGGRAALFRSTDEEVTSAYARSPFPYGTVVSGDAFEKGLVRSDTDYSIFKGFLGYRGLDVAFIGPRARYHTNEDDSRHTGRKAIWHMLSSAVATTKDLTSRNAITPDDEPHRSIWFDLFGKAFVLLRAHTFFALSVSLLVVGPIILLVTLLFLHRADKLYLFSNSRRVSNVDFDESINLYGWRGCFRFPFILLFASAAPIALAYLLFKENEQIAHSSPWPVWAMMVSAFIFVAWFVARFADYVRPSALTRAYGFGWLTVAWWLILIAAVIYEEQFHLGGLYFALFFCAFAGTATWLSYVELFSLPKKGKYCAGKTRSNEDTADSRTSSRPPPTTSRDQGEGEEGDDEPDERTGLLPKLGKTISADGMDAIKTDYDEQDWSKSQWNWLWIVEWLVLLPNVIILGHLGLYLVDGLHQTGQDGGNNEFLVYLGIAIVTIFFFSPMVPVIHRVTWHIPLFLLLVLIGTLLYNLLAFPFSAQNRVKLYFQQEIDLNQGNNTVSLAGIQPFLYQAVSTIPSAAGNSVVCNEFRDYSKCSWTGIPAEVVPSNSSLSTKKRYKTWMNYDAAVIAKSPSNRTARFTISGKNTRACKLVFDHPISAFNVSGQGSEDKRFKPVPKNGSSEIRLWSRTWDRRWIVDVSWNSDEYGKALSGKAVCLWSDVNQKGLIPAFDEAAHFVPTWAAVTKLADGLVEGYKTFSV